MKQVVESLVEGGKATPGPPLGPALGPLGVNISAVVAAINEKTKDFAGMKVPVKVIVDPKTKAFEIEVGTPPTSALIIKELGIEKGSSDAKSSIVGNLTMEQAVKIARMKRDGMLASSLKAATKEVLGTCVSMGVTVEGKPAKEVQREIDEGKYDHLFEG
ncbi:MAG: 50S ribosomal protein L11 [Euryarchaeota archaeon]|nr:50S ribosomal protein L11 [Euryarchaeota archaeon]